MRTRIETLTTRIALIPLLLFLSPGLAEAAYFTLPVLTTEQTDPVFKSLAGAFVFRDLEPASDLGKKFGLTVGVRASVIDATALSTVVSGLNTPLLPSGDLQGAIGLPHGFTFEFGMIPTLTYQGTSFSEYSGAVKWTATRTFLPKLPFSLAARAAYTTANLSYAQSISGVDVSVAYSTTLLSFQAIVSRKFLVFEPYLSLGFVTHSSSISSSGSASIFGTTFPVGTQSYSSSLMSFWPSAGLMINLFVLGISGEYSNLWGLGNYSLKVSLRI